MNKIKIALLGLGTVGGGTYEILQRQKDEMKQKLGAEIEVSKILVHNKEKKREGVLPELLTDDFQEILNDKEIQIVVEMMGGMELPKEYILASLKAGKHVVTANKDLLAVHGKELLEEAEKQGNDLLFEAAVAGGIPIIRPLKQCLAGNKISEVMGIINGTTNFILTKMTQDGMEFTDALALATELGYAEADPTADVEGHDAGRKIAIMASIAFHSRVTFSDVYMEGITKISAADIAYAKELGSVIKLLGVAKEVEGKIEVGVYPMLIAKEHPLASVNDSFNAVFVHGDAVDDAMFLGRGAGALPTGSAIVGDIFDIARNIGSHATGRIHCSCYKELEVKPFEETSHNYFLRMQVEDQTGVFAEIAKVFAEYEVSLSQVIQKNKNGEMAEIVITTGRVIEKNFHKALEVCRKMTCIKEISTIIRVYSK